MQTATIAALLFSICFALYSSTINGYFLADDFGYVQLYYRQNFSVLATILASDWSQGIWGFNLPEMRPVIALSYLWDSWLWGINPFGYHFTNVLIHALNALLVYLLANQLARIKPEGAITAATLFAMHPVHAEAVSWIAGRTDLISTFFYLSGLIAFGFYRMRGQTRYWLISLALYLLGMFSKEIVVSFPLMVLVYDICYGRQATVRSRTQWWAPHLTNLALLAGYFWLRQRAFGSSLGGGEVALRPMLAELYQRQIYYLSSLFPLEARLLERYSKVWILVLASLLILVLGLRLFNRGFRNQAGSAIAFLYLLVIYFGLVWYLISMAPLVRTTYISSRHLYFASAGICIVVGCMLVRLLPKTLFVIASLLLVVAYGHLLHKENKSWRKAGQLSTRMHNEIHSLLKDTPAGNGLIINLPGNMDKAWFWAWASPFVFRQPFSPAQLDEHFQILESPAIYCCDWSRHRLPLARQLLERPVDSHIFFIGADDQLVKKKIPQDQLRARLSEILAGADWNKIWMGEATANSP
jgi:protein O-mannosyl-transferase